jgi:cyclic 2,3-diphosphoglycerate synthetase
VHAASDNYEDAVMSRVTTVGARRCGGGMAGATFFDNVAEAASVADSLGKELLIFEGSGAAIPPVRTDANIIVIGAGQGVSYVRDYFGPYRFSLADLAIIASAEEPVAGAQDVRAIRGQIERVLPDLPVVTTVFRPHPIEPVGGKRVFFATTAPTVVLPVLVSYLETTFGCEVVGSSASLSNRSLLGRDLDAATGKFDVLLTELKAAAIDVVADTGERLGVPTVLCDNIPVAVDGTDLGVELEAVARNATERGSRRKA